MSQAAPATGPAPATAPVTPEAGGRMMRAALTVPAAEARGRAPTAAPAIAGRPGTVSGPATAPSTIDGEDDEQRPATTMLLAAVALMTGIALRRWGVGRP